MKALLKTIVMSATYQQSSLVAADSAKKDPRNRLLGYTLIVEVIFRWPGLGSQLVDAVLKRDYLVAQILALLLTLVVIILNTFADIAYAYADPKVRVQVAKA